jgi:hypothetical protein
VSVSKKRVIILQRRSREPVQKLFHYRSRMYEGENTSNLLSLHASALLGARINMHTHIYQQLLKSPARNLERMGKMTRRGKSGVKVCAFINKTNLLSRDGLMARDSQECIIL